MDSSPSRCWCMMQRFLSGFGAAILVVAGGVRFSLACFVSTDCPRRRPPPCHPNLFRPIFTFLTPVIVNRSKIFIVMETVTSGLLS
ncbi:hypothetical protein QL285_002531 [Trifolium repens]|nr:hypothetical protein QL285_002531 [Trifolium repens]